MNGSVHEFPTPRALGTRERLDKLIEDREIPPDVKAALCEVLSDVGARLERMDVALAQIKADAEKLIRARLRIVPRDDDA